MSMRCGRYWSEREPAFLFTTSTVIPIFLTEKQLANRAPHRRCSHLPQRGHGKTPIRMPALLPGPFVQRTNVRALRSISSNSFGWYPGSAMYEPASIFLCTSHAQRMCGNCPSLSGILVVDSANIVVLIPFTVLPLILSDSEAIGRVGQGCTSAEVAQGLGIKMIERLGQCSCLKTRRRMRCWRLIATTSRQGDSRGRGQLLRVRPLSLAQAQAHHDLENRWRRIRIDAGYGATMLAL